MQNRGAIWIFTILLAIACAWQLSFSVFTGKLESTASTEAGLQADSVLALDPGLPRDSLVLIFENKYLRLHDNDVVYPVFGYTYGDCKSREINLGLDLKGGMAVTLEVSIPEMVENLAGTGEGKAYDQFKQAMAAARKRQSSSTEDFISLFSEEWNRVDANGVMASVFVNSGNQTIFNPESDNAAIVASLHREAETAVSNTERILRTRIDKFGVSQPSIQKQQFSGRIQIELPGVKDKERVRKVLQSTANLEFWETYDNTEIGPKLNAANAPLSLLLHPDLAAEKDSLDLVAKLDSATKATADSLKLAAAAMVPDSLKEDSTVVTEETDTTSEESVDSLAMRADAIKKNPLRAKMDLILTPQGGLASGSAVGVAAITDTAEVNKLLSMSVVKNALPADCKLLWEAKPRTNAPRALYLHAIRIPRDGKAKLDGSSIIDARQDYSSTGEVEVNMQMDPKGAQTWKLMTTENTNKVIAIVLDDLVFSAPVVNGPIPNGSSVITLGSGPVNEQLAEANDLANILKAGALPAPARIIDETVVGPSLGEENIQNGMVSFAIALLVVMIFMVLYYGGSGWVANVALLANVFLLLGTLASLQASLTLPGIAGIVLTVGMAVDANVLINERIREELRHGKMMKSAIDLGYKHAMSAIIDANVTHFFAAVILYIFGTGPIKSFGTTLGLGILTSLFTAIFISRLIITRRLEKGKSITFWRDWNKNIFVGTNVKFMEKRKYFYLFSGALIAIGMVSIFTQGFNYGVDFEGGRTYVVKFAEPVEIETVKNALEPQFNADGRQYSVVVKTYGGSDQVKITTNYLADSSGTVIDGQVEAKLEAGLSAVGKEHAIKESRKVDATISDDIKRNAWIAVAVALAFMFIYIALRFKTWQFGLGAMLSLLHDVLIVIGLYSLLWKIMPFSLEIDEHFIAAILTVVGYSINDTVVVFDRIREYLQYHKRDPWITVFDRAINSTLGRTINTSVTVLIVLLVIFLLGGVSIKGFVFAMLVGILVGTYSSIFIASAVVVDLHKETSPEAKAVPSSSAA